MAQAQWSTFAEEGAVLIVQEPYRRAVSGALLRGEACEPLNRGGRGGILRFALDDGAGIVRRCRRGGLIQRLIQDSYVLVNRPLREWRIHTYLYEQGVATAEPLGLCWRRRGLFYSGALATREIAHAQTLHALLTSPNERAGNVMASVGALTRRMHDLGVLHGDLQVANILVKGAQPFVIDFGNARRATRASAAARAQDLLRFRRSLSKNNLSAAWYERFCEGYGAFAIPAGMDLAYRLKAVVSDILSGGRPGGGSLT